MTKQQIAKVEKFLRKNVDDTFICAIRVNGKGSHVFAKKFVDIEAVGELFAAQIQVVFNSVQGSPEHVAQFKKLFIQMLTDIAEEL